MDWETLQRQRYLRTWMIGAGAVLILHAFLPLGAILGQARFFAGPKTYSILWLGLGLPVYYFFIRYALLGPIVNSGFLNPERSPARLLFALVVWGLPLLSFAYWLGDFKNALHAYDLAFFLVGAIAGPLLLYWRTGEVGPLAFGVTFGSFSTLFLMSDVLGPFSTLGFYAAEGPGFYVLRTLGLASSFLMAAFYPLPQVGRVFHSKTAIGSLWALTIGGLGLFVLSFFPNELGETVFPEFAWVGFAVLLYFHERKDVFGKKAFITVSLLVMASLAFQWVREVVNPDASLLGQLRLYLNTLGLWFLGWNARKRWKQTKTDRHSEFYKTSLPKEPQTPASAALSPATSPL